MGIFGNKVWVGSPGFFQLSGSGAVYLFDSMTGNLLDTVSNTVPQYGDNFDRASKYTDNLFLIGAPGQYNGKGAVYLFTPNHNCIPPQSGNWTITSSCVLSASFVAPASVILQNNSVLTIPSGITLDIDFVVKHLLVKSGSKVLIKSSGKIF